MSLKKTETTMTKLIYFWFFQVVIKHSKTKMYNSLHPCPRPSFSGRSTSLIRLCDHTLSWLWWSPCALFLDRPHAQSPIRGSTEHVFHKLPPGHLGKLLWLKMSVRVHEEPSATCENGMPFFFFTLSFNVPKTKESSQTHETPAVLKKIRERICE